MFNGVNCPKCGRNVELVFKPGRERWVICADGHRFDVFVVLGRKGGRQRKPFTPEERQRRRELLAKVRSARWPVKSPALLS
jgi:hypothetical protein